MNEQQLRELLQESFEELTHSKAQIAKLENQLHEPIAIVSMACRFGGAASPEELWALYLAATNTACERPDHPSRATLPSGMRASYLDAIDLFDAAFFEMSPREAQQLDPQQRVLLEVAWEALERAGISRADTRGKPVGVFIGASSIEYSSLTRNVPKDVYTVTGSTALSALSGRLSYFFGMTGPSMTLDAGCTSSLVAVHAAAQALRRRECDMALAGAVYLILEDLTIGSLDTMGVVSKHGRCSSFAAQADGFVPGEGCGLIILKRLTDAQRDGDDILALIMGSAVNHVGASNGMTAPTTSGQSDVIRRALADAGVSASDVSYVECHATGSSMGDAIEVQAIGSAYESDARAARLLLGSTKPTLGHGLPASSMAALIKTVMGMRTRELPGVPVDSLNSSIPWEELRLEVVQKTTPWRAEQRVAGVHAYSMTGGNAHVIVAEAPRPAAKRATKDVPTAVLPILISGHTEAAVSAQIRRLIDHIERNPATDLRDIAWTLANGRTHMNYRVVLLTSGIAELASALRQAAGSRRVLADAKHVEGPIEQAPAVAFAFPSESAERMGLDLYSSNEVFRASFDEIMSEFGGRQGQPPTSFSRTFALQVSLARTFERWGVLPDHLAATGIGELAAAFVASVFELSDACQLVEAFAAAVGSSDSRGAVDALVRTAAAIELAPPSISTSGFDRAAELDLGRFAKRSYWEAQLESVRSSQRTGLGRELPDIAVALMFGTSAGDSPQVLPAVSSDGADASTLRAVAALHVAGVDIDWRSVLARHRGDIVMMPTYEWQRERHWVEVPKSVASAVHVHATPWSLVHRHVQSSVRAGEHLFETEIDLGSNVLSTLQLEMVFEGARIVHESHREIVVEDVRFLASSSTAAKVRLQLVLEPPQGTHRPIHLAWSPSDDRRWTTPTTGRLVLDDARSDIRKVLLPELQKRCPTKLDHAALRGIETISTGDGEALAKLEAFHADPGSGEHVLPPALLDAALRLPAAVAGRGPFAPATLGAARVSSKSTPRWVHASLLHASDEAIDVDLTLLDEKGRLVAVFERLHMVPVRSASDKLDQHLFRVAWPSSPSSARESVDGGWLLFVDDGAVGTALRAWIESRGGHVVTASRGPAFASHDETRFTLDPADPQGFVRLLEQTFSGMPLRRVVHLWSLDARDREDVPLNETTLDRAESLACTSLAHLVQSFLRIGRSEAPRLFIVTRNCQAVRGSSEVVFPEQALAWGFGASIMHELPELRTTLVDIDRDVTVERLAQTLAGADDEDRVAVRGSERRVARLVPHTRPAKPPGAPRLLEVRPDAGYTMSVLGPDEIASFGFRPSAVPTPAPGQVVIRTRAMGVSRRVATALRAGEPASGVVHSVGGNVTTLQPGDEVVALTSDGFGAYTLASESLVVKKPASLSFEQGAGVATSVLTVFFALEKVARLARGERILIPDATEDVGLAALSYAKRAGATIFATSATEEGRAYLRSIGVTNVYDSQEARWVEDLARDLNGGGFDVVFNSCTGESATQVLGLLASGGKFIDVGGNAALLAGLLRPNTTLTAVSIEQLVRDRPDDARALLVAALCLLEEGALSALPLVIFPSSRVGDAVDRVARRGYIGHVVLAAEEEVLVRDPAHVSPVRPDGTYLISGGFGSLGLVVARRLAKMGARHLALLGRTGPSESARAVVRDLESSGVCVHLVRVDVADRAALDEALLALLRSAPAVAGVVHAAGVADDAPIAALTSGRIAKTLAPKVKGALALSTVGSAASALLRIYFGSIAGVLGSAGQAHDAAANAFLDAHAHYLTARSRPTLTLDWSPWDEVGGARVRHPGSIARQGLATFSHENGAEIFERLIAEGSIRVVPFAIDVAQWRQANARLAAMPLLGELTSSAMADSKNSNLLARLRAATSESERVDAIAEYLCTTIAGILHSSPDVVTRAAPFKQLGFDSLMTVRLKNTLERDVGVPLATATLFAYSSVEKLALHLSKLVGAETSPAPLPVSNPSSSARTSEKRPDPSERSSLADLLKESLSQLRKDRIL